jgi:hypothetical protein
MRSREHMIVWWKLAVLTTVRFRECWFLSKSLSDHGDLACLEHAVINIVHGQKYNKGLCFKGDYDGVGVFNNDVL